jgi:hypothetical protein
MAENKCFGIVGIEDKNGKRIIGYKYNGIAEEHAKVLAEIAGAPPNCLNDKPLERNGEKKC